MDDLGHTVRWELLFLPTAIGNILWVLCMLRQGHKQLLFRQLAARKTNKKLKTECILYHYVGDLIFLLSTDKLKMDRNEIGLKSREAIHSELLTRHMRKFRGPRIVHACCP